LQTAYEQLTKKGGGGGEATGEAQALKAQVIGHSIVPVHICNILPLPTVKCIELITIIRLQFDLK